MASEPKKDNTSETALRAVEDALNIDFNEIEPSGGKDAPPPPQDFDPDFSELEQKLAEAANDLRRQSEQGDEPAPAEPVGAAAAPERRPGRRRPGRNAGAARPQPAAMAEPADLLPANDERQNAIADIVYSLQQRSSSRPYIAALVLSAAWVVVCGALVYYALRSGQLEAAPGSLLNQPMTWGLVALTTVPVLLIWAFAMMVRRAQDMRLAARSMTEAAIRLLQPEEMAASSVASVGRAIRREVAAINEGVERALARAGELEQIVGTEVGNLERSYADAEVRLKGLVSELAEERHDIVSHVDRLRDSLTGTHRGITEEVDAVAARIESAVLATSSRVVESLDQEGKIVVSNLESVSGRLTEMLSQSGSQMAETIALRATDFDRIVQERIGDLDNSVERRLTGFGTVLDGRIETVFDKIAQQQKYVEDATSRVESIVNDQITTASKEFGTRGVALVKALGTQTQALERVLDDRAKRLGVVISERLSDFGQDVTSHMDMVVGRLNEKNEAMETATSRIENAIAAHVTRFDQALRERAMDVARSFSAGKDIIGGALDEAMAGVSAKALEAKLGIENVQGALTSAMDERIGTISDSLNAGQQRLVSVLDKMDNRSTGLVAEIDQRTENMGELISKAGYKLAALIDQRNEAIQRGIAEGHQRLEAELDKMDNRSTGLIAEIDKRTERMGEVVQDASLHLAAVIEQRTESIGRSIDEGQQRLVAELDRMDNRSTGLVAEIDKRTEHMSQLVNDAGEKLASVIDQRTFSIRDQLVEGQQLIAAEFHKMDNSSSGLISELQKRASGLVADIDSRSTGLFSELDKRSAGFASEIERRTSGLISEIDLRTQGFGDVIGQAGERLTSSIDERTHSIRDHLVEGQQLIISELDRMDDRSIGLVNEIDRRTNHMSGLINEAGEKLSSILDQRTFAIRDQLVEGQQLIASELDKMDNRSTGLVAEIDRRAGHMGVLIDEASEKFSSVLDQRTFAIRDHLLEGQNLIMAELDKMDNRSTGLVAELDKRTQNMGLLMEEASEKMSSVIDQRTFAIRDQLAEGQHLIMAELDKMDDRSSGLVAAIDKRANDMGLLIDGAADKLSSVLDQRTFAIRDQLIEGQQLITSELDKMDNRSTGLVGEITRRATQMGSLIEQAGDHLASVLDQRTFAIRENLMEGQQLIATELDKMDNRSTGLVADIDKRTQNMGALIGEAGKKLAAALDQRMFAIRDNLIEGQEMLSAEFDRIDNRTTGLVTEIDRRSQRLGEAVAAASGSMLSQLDERTDIMRKSLTDSQNRLFDEVDRLDERNTTLISELEKQSDRVNATLRQAGTDLSSTFESGISLLRQNIGEGQQAIFSEIEHFGQSGAQLIEQIGAKAQVLGDAMDNAADHIGSVIDEKNRSIFATMRAGRDEFLSELEKGSRDMVISLDGKRMELSQQLHEHIEMTGQQIDSKAEALTALLTERANLINSSLGSELIETQRSLESRTREFSLALAERARELSTIIDEQGMPVVEGLRAGGADLVAEIERAGSNLTSEFSTLLENIGISTQALDETVANASRSIGSIERNIVEGTSRLAESVDKASLDSENARQVAERIASNVGETTEYLLTNLSNNSLRFEKQVKQLREASEFVTVAQKQLAHVLETRQEPLEQLAASLTERSSAIEQSIINFSSVLGSLIQDMMAKASNAGNKVTSEIETAFDQALARLGETVEAMRTASEEIRSELEQTRAQMRRGVMELPVEVKESADTMRRVLVDQISALKELSEIVTKSGKAYDATPPSPQPRLVAGGGAPRPSMQMEAVRTPSPAPRPTLSPRAARAPAPDLNVAPIHASAHASVEPAIMERRYEAEAEPHRLSERGQHTEPRPASQQGSWVSELLRRASRDEGEAPARPAAEAPRQTVRDAARDTARASEPSRAPEQAIDSLNSLSMDIARAIDHDASVDLWERYRRGERNVFTRRLYTMQGQKTFDEIRAKYSRDAEFRAAVDRYIGDFEQLLEDVGRNDRDHMMTQTYLTSDTGKVYTMLAHAAGRLGEG